MCIRDSHQTQKRRRLTLEEQVVAEAARDEARADRLRWMRQALVDASLEKLPQRYRDRYNGDIAVDSTEVPVLGKVHSKATTLVRKGHALDDKKVVAARKSLRTGGYLTNVDFSAGTYDHSHRDDKPNTPPRAAYEMDIVTMMDTEGYDEKRHPAFARLITGVGFHRPGRITSEPREAVFQHARNFVQRGIAAADRAFNGMESENFSQPLRMDGFEFAYDYKKDQFGLQARVPGLPLIVVDGALYVKYMPKRLQYITYWFHNDEVDPETGELVTEQEMRDAIAERAVYAMKRKGDIGMTRKGVQPLERDRGKQRFSYPDPKSYIAHDPATNKRIPHAKNELRGSVLVNPYAEVVRHLQRHPWGSPEWRKAYGQRNQVESVNKAIKHTRFTDLESAAKRPGRGEAYQSIATALMAVAYNVRALVRALIKECAPKKNKQTRAPRAEFNVNSVKNARSVTDGALAPPA